MPNWCSGFVDVEGKPKDVEQFCKRFVFEDEPKDKYFARSFVHDKWKDFKKRHKLGKAKKVCFSVDFAWSSYSCLIEGYPQKNEDCITLKDACKLHKVKVVIDTEEGGIGFEEHVVCNKNGKLLYSSENMPLYECVKCKEKSMFASDYDPDMDGEICFNCEEYNGWRSVK